MPPLSNRSSVGRAVGRGFESHLVRSGGRRHFMRCVTVDIGAARLRGSPLSFYIGTMTTPSEPRHDYGTALVPLSHAQLLTAADALASRTEPQARALLMVFTDCARSLELIAEQEADDETTGHGAGDVSIDG